MIHFPVHDSFSISERITLSELPQRISARWLTNVRSVTCMNTTRQFVRPPSRKGTVATPKVVDGYSGGRTFSPNNHEKKNH